MTAVTVHLMNEIVSCGFWLVFLKVQMSCGGFSFSFGVWCWDFFGTERVKGDIFLSELRYLIDTFCGLVWFYVLFIWPVHNFVVFVCISNPQ